MPQGQGKESVANPNDTSHASLEWDVQYFLRKNRFYFMDNTYHRDTVSENHRKRLQYINTPTAFAVRGRADRLAIHERQPIVFQWEAKTHHVNTKGDNMSLEVMPFIHHWTDTFHWVKCLYVYRHPVADGEPKYDVGFWLKKNCPPPPIWRVIVPTGRWTDKELHWFRVQIETYLPFNGIIEEREGSRGSDDPFLLIRGEDVANMPDWRDLILEEWTDSDDPGVAGGLTCTR